MEDFVVVTRGQCFLCLDKISPVYVYPPIKLEHEYLESEAVTSSTSTYYHSIGHLSRYLGMNNLREVYRNEEGIISSNNKLVAIGGRSRLKVQLCEECAGLNEALSKQCQQLEKIELEVVSSLEKIRRKLLIAEKTGRAQQFRNDGHVDETTTPLGGVKGKFQIAEELRFDALEKCSQKLKLASPRLKLQKLTLNQLEVKCKIRANLISHGCSGTSGNDHRSPSSALTILVERIKSENCQGYKEEEEKEYPDVDVEASEPSPLSPILNVPEMGSNRECELRRPEDSELSTPIVLTHLKVEQESYLESGNSSESEARKTMMSGKSTRMANTKKTTNSSFNDKSVTIPAPIKMTGVADGKFQISVDAETGKHKCDSCSKQFAKTTAVRRHYESVHLKVRCKCTVCGKNFADSDGYRAHYKKAHIQVRFKCERCNKTFAQKYTYLNPASTECSFWITF